MSLRSFSKKYGAKKDHKYKAVSTNSFPSKLEAAVYQMLCLREKAGEIRDIKRQVVVYLSDARIPYKVDFSYIQDIEDAEFEFFVEAKGFESETWRLKKKLWNAYGPGTLEIWGGHHERIQLIETIVR